MFIRDRDVHYYEQTTDSDCQFINLSFNREVLDDLIAFLGEGFPSERLLDPAMPPSTVLSKTEKEYVRYRLDQLSLIPQEKKLAVKAEVRAILTDLFSRYIKAEVDPIDLTGQPEWFKALCRDAKRKSTSHGERRAC